jgi:tetratricopeptide (TPR) repeat protein
MKKNYQIVVKIFIITLIFILPSVVFSQNANREEGSDKLVYQWYVNLNGGITQSYCDIQGGSWHGAMLNKKDMEFGFGARIGKHISPVFGIYGAFMRGPLEGRSGVDTKNLTFKTSLLDTYLGTTFSLSNLVFGYKPRLVNVYGTVGIGLSNFTPQAYKADGVTPQIPDSSDTSIKSWGNTTEAMVPTGIGVDFRINNRWDANFETTIRWFDSDKLDGYKSGSKNDAYYFTSVGVGYSFNLGKPSAKMRIETEPSLLALHGDSIPIEVKGNFPETFNKKAVVEFTPVLKYGDKMVKLPPMYFQGTEVAPEYQKQGAVTIPETGGAFTYKTYVKYEPGMDICELYVDPMAAIKGGKPFSMTDRKVADGLIMTSKRINNVERLILADHGYRRNIEAKEMGIIYYVVNRYDLNFGYKLNKDEKAIAGLKKLNDFVARNWEIKSIDINAWASPEGEESLNQGLSQNRSEAGKKYFEGEYDKFVKAEAKKLNVKPETIKQSLKFNLKANGEDWDGFMAALDASEIKDKNIIKNVVNSQPDPAKREQEIRNMTVIYKEIEEDILPPLRRSEIVVACYEPSRNDDEIAQLASTSPDSLTINELLYSATLTTDNHAKLNIYKTMIQKYPNDWRGYNNAGYVSAELGDFDSAETFFNKAKSLSQNNGSVLNNTGAMASKDKDFDAAKADYMAAQKQGVDVNYNMGIIKIADGNYNGAINSFGSVKCDYNLALAHVLSGNYNAATSALNCAEKTPEVFYLQAIIGARTNEDAMVFDNLKKAIAADSSYKETAKNDREFFKLYGNPEFQTITQ